MPAILVVEDDLECLDAMSRHPTDDSFEVVGVSDTLAALDRVDARQDFDVLVADVVMPAGRPNGLAFARMARLRIPRLRVLLVTGHRHVLDGIRPPHPVLYKPYSMPDVSAAIRALLAA
jgi:DNA-binding response OmpR family regulator